MQVAEWHGQQEPPFTDDILKVLGVDDYLVRVYSAPPPDRAGVGLYIGYWGTQRQGDTIHSPLNCLPGSGWEPLEKQRVQLRTPNGPVMVNELVIEKGLDHQLVLYWYQAHGRVVASEYWGKTYLVLDALRLNRTDGSMIRVITGLGDNPKQGRPRATAIAHAFAEMVLPMLGPYVPS